MVKTPKKEGEEAPKKRRMTAAERNEILIENFAGLQHAMTNLSIKFGALSDNISQLLKLFEEASKTFIKQEKPDETELIKKIDTLLDQNKAIAKGLILVEEKLSSQQKAPAPRYTPHQTPAPISGNYRIKRTRPLPTNGL